MSTVDSDRSGAGRIDSAPRWLLRAIMALLFMLAFALIALTDRSDKRDPKANDTAPISERSPNGDR
jgi:hypothetical protein